MGLKQVWVLFGFLLLSLSRGTLAVDDPWATAPLSPKACPFQTLLASRTTTEFESGVRSIDLETAQEVRSGKITKVLKGSYVTESGERKQAAIKQIVESQKEQAPDADPLGQEFRMLKTVWEAVGEDGKKYFPRPLALGPDFVAVEWTDGITIADLYKQGPLKPELANSIFEQLTEATNWLSRVGVAHGDISPSNIVLKPDGTITLIDFGIALKFGDPHRSTGTPDFNSPWQRFSIHPDQRYKDSAIASARDNNYGLGAMQNSLKAHTEGAVPESELVRRSAVDTDTGAVQQEPTPANSDPRSVPSKTPRAPTASAPSTMPDTGPYQPTSRTPDTLPGTGPYRPASQPPEAMPRPNRDDAVK